MSDAGAPPPWDGDVAAPYKHAPPLLVPNLVILCQTVRT